MITRKPISIIVAIAANHAIGKDNQLLWHLSEDLKRFKRMTTGSHIVMGKKTFESLPMKPLPKRTSVIITDDKNDDFENCITVFSIDEAIEKCPADKESFIIGGGSVYKQFMPIAQTMYITKVHQDFEADTFFPEIDTEIWEVAEESETFTDENNSLKYSFLTYKKK